MAGYSDRVSSRENLFSGFSDKVRFKPACSAAGTSQNSDFYVASLFIRLCRERIARPMVQSIQAGMCLCCFHATQLGFLATMSVSCNMIMSTCLFPSLGLLPSQYPISSHYRPQAKRHLDGGSIVARFYVLTR